jgi:hypothetical protein
MDFGWETSMAEALEDDKERSRMAAAKEGSHAFSHEATKNYSNQKVKKKLHAAAKAQ